jgi:hypothetical protein
MRPASQRGGLSRNTGGSSRSIAGKDLDGSKMLLSVNWRFLKVRVNGRLRRGWCETASWLMNSQKKHFAMEPQHPFRVARSGEGYPAAPRAPDAVSLVC